MAPLPSPQLSCATCATPVSVGADKVTCTACGWTPEMIDGIIDLREDKAFDTLLDIDAYDAAHGVAVQTTTLANMYERLLRDQGSTSAANVFEMGAGSGNLTFGMVASPFFGTVHTSDISPGFMKLLQKRVACDDSNLLRTYLLDANNNPFRDDCFDLVVGHSILHHLESFERTIEESFRVTRTGGHCIFGEPVLDIHVFAGLVAAIILHMEQAQGSLDRPRRMALTALAQRPQIKRNNLESDRTGLREIEDKFMFPIDYMRNLAARIGFTGFECISPPDPKTLGQQARFQIERVFAQIDADAGFLESYGFLFDAVSENYGNPMKLNDTTPFSYFVFSK